MPHSRTRRSLRPLLPLQDTDQGTDPCVLQERTRKAERKPERKSWGQAPLTAASRPEETLLGEDRRKSHEAPEKHLAAATGGNELIACCHIHGFPHPVPGAAVRAHSCSLIQLKPCLGGPAAQSAKGKPSPLAPFSHCAEVAKGLTTVLHFSWAVANSKTQNKYFPRLQNHPPHAGKQLQRISIAPEA